MKYFKKIAMVVDFSNHFWDRVYSRPKVKADLAGIDKMLKDIGSPDTYVDDIPELKFLIGKQDTRFVYQEQPSSAKYLFDLKKDPVTGKHSFVAVTGLNPEHKTHKTFDITPTLNLLMSQKRFQ